MLLRGDREKLASVCGEDSIVHTHVCSTHTHSHTWTTRENSFPNQCVRKLCLTFFSAPLYNTECECTIITTCGCDVYMAYIVVVRIFQYTFLLYGVHVQRSLFNACPQCMPSFFGPSTLSLTELVCFFYYFASLGSKPFSSFVSEILVF